MKNGELRRERVKQDAERARHFDPHDLAPVACFTISPEGLILEANLAAAELLGAAKSELIKQPISHFILPADQEVFKNRYCIQLLETDAIVTFDLWMMKKDGTVFRGRLKTTHAQGADGATVYLVVISDITKSIQDKLRLEEQLRFETLFSDISVGFVNLAPDQLEGSLKNAQRLVCEALNLDISAIFLWPTQTRRGATLAYLYQSPGVSPVPSGISADQYFPWCRDQLEAGRIVAVSSKEDLPAEAAVDRESWRKFGIKSSLVCPLKPSEGLPIGTIGFGTIQEKRIWPERLVKRLQMIGQMVGNVIIRMQTETAFRESEERLILTTEAVAAGLWMMEADTGKVWVSSKGRELFHFAPDEDIVYESFLRVMHPEDRERIQRDVQQALRSGEPLRCDFRIVLPDGNIKWISAHGKRNLKSAGKPDCIMGLSLDITERKGLELRLIESQALLTVLVDSTSDMIWSVDSERFGLLTFNRGLYDYFLDQRGIQIRAGMRPEDLFPTEDYVQQWRTFYRRALHDGSFTTEYRVFAGTRILRLNINRLESIDGVFGVSVFGQDITALKKLEDELRQSLEEVQRLRERLQEENLYLREVVKSRFMHSEIVGDSKPMREVLSHAEQVSATGSTVLILGETGTGKELLARAIHEMSNRKDQTMIVVNCASLPPTLIESELFGREKGAYTGSLTKMIGRFELADGSTLFLDEIGDLPLELQSKLLRVLEQGQFERLGSTRTIKVNVRLIAATNRDLAKEILEGKFRKDLYYRLNVFPMTVPPLRERKEDIPMLVWSFVKHFEKFLGKHIDSIPKKDMDALINYHWPGNIRELRNVVEHAMILSSARTLTVRPPTDASMEQPGSYALQDMERKHMLEVLEKTGWRISGKNGAAEILGMKRTTLQSKMKALSIKRSVL